MQLRQKAVIGIIALGIGGLVILVLVATREHHGRLEAEQQLVALQKELAKLREERGRLRKELAEVEAVLRRAADQESATERNPEADWLCDRLPCNPAEKLRKRPSCPPGDPLCSSTHNDL